LHIAPEYALAHAGLARALAAQETSEAGTLIRIFCPLKDMTRHSQLKEAKAEYAAIAEKSFGP
jgi:hypothetical protein